MSVSPSSPEQDLDAAPAATVPAGPPPQSFAAGAWTFSYTVVSNPCGTTPVQGQKISVRNYYWEKQPNDGYISDGETLLIYHEDGTYAGETILRWPVMEFTITYRPGIYQYVRWEFSRPDRAFAHREEHYATANSKCVVVWETPR